MTTDNVRTSESSKFSPYEDIMQSLFRQPMTVFLCLLAATAFGLDCTSSDGGRPRRPDLHTR